MTYFRPAEVWRDMTTRTAPRPTASFDRRRDQCRDEFNTGEARPSHHLGCRWKSTLYDLSGYYTPSSSTCAKGVQQRRGFVRIMRFKLAGCGIAYSSSVSRLHHAANAVWAGFSIGRLRPVFRRPRRRERGHPWNEITGHRQYLMEQKSASRTAR